MEYVDEEDEPKSKIDPRAKRVGGAVCGGEFAEAGKLAGELQEFRKVSSLIRARNTAERASVTRRR
jgi:hypothetical protein